MHSLKNIFQKITQNKYSYLSYIYIYIYIVSIKSLNRLKQNNQKEWSTHDWLIYENIYKETYAE